MKSCLLAAGAGAALRAVGLTRGGFARKSASGESIWTECVRGLLPGLLVMGIAVVSGEQIGKGDAWILLTLGVLTGAGQCVSLFVTALIVSVPFSAVWYRLCRRKSVSGQSERPGERLVPFAPSLFLAYLLLSFFS